MEIKRASQSDAIDADVCKVRCFHPVEVQRIRQCLQTDAPQVSVAAALFKTLGSTRRLSILRALHDTELCVCDIAHVLGLSMAATSQQLRQLRAQGWITLRNDGKMVYYRLSEKRPLREVALALAMLGADETRKGDQDIGR